LAPLPHRVSREQASANFTSSKQIFTLPCRNFHHASYSEQPEELYMRKLSLFVLAVSILFAGFVTPAMAQYNYGFSVAIVPQAVTISQGTVTSFKINIASRDPEQYRLSILGLPSGVISSITSQIVGPGATQIELRAASNAAIGPASVQVSVARVVSVGRPVPLDTYFTLTIQPPSASAQKSGSRAAAWEYTTATGYSPEDFANKANALGDQLWDLISVTQNSAGQQWTGFFKRVKQ
jgi:hypothetical protein